MNEQKEFSVLGRIEKAGVENGIVDGVVLF